MFGLGAQEILILLVLVGGLATIILLRVFLGGRGGRVAQLEEENRRLRERLREEREQDPNAG